MHSQLSETKQGGDSFPWIRFHPGGANVVQQRDARKGPATSASLARLMVSSMMLNFLLGEAFFEAEVEARSAGRFSCGQSKAGLAEGLVGTEQRQVVSALEEILGSGEKHRA